MARRKRTSKPLPTIWHVPDELWERIEPVLNELDPPARTGRKRIAPRPALEGIIYPMRTGCQWNVLPLCLDKGYDNPTGHRAVEEHHYQPHIRRIGEPKPDPKRRKRHPARRWVVERTLGWLSKCRAIMVRHAKLPSVYLGLIQLAYILLWFRRFYRLKEF